MKKVADAVLVAMMLMASVPSLAEDTAALLPNASPSTMIGEQLLLPSGEDSIHLTDS